MMKAWNVKLIGALLVLMFLATLSSISLFSKSVSADIVVQQYQQPGFDAFFKKKPRTACACSPIKEELYIINTADTVQSFRTEFSMSKFHAVRSFILEPGEQKILVFNLTMPCDKKEIHYQATITNYYETKILTNNVKIEKCQNLKLGLATNLFSIDPCQTIMLNASLENTNSFEEYYRLTLKKPEKWVTTFKDMVVKLKSFSKYDFNFSVTPNCEFYGNKTIILKADALLNKIQAEMPININVNRYYPFDVNLTPYNTCNEFLYEFPITIENKAGFENQFFLSMDRKTKMFAKLRDNNIVVNANSVNNTVLIVDPRNLKPGNYTISLRVSSEKGLLEANVQKNFMVLDCINIESDFENKIPDKLCVGDMFNFSLWNDATSNISVVLTANGFYFKDLENKIKNKTTSSKLNITLSKNKRLLEGVINDIVDVLTLNIRGKHLPISESFSKHVVVLSKYDCYKPSIKINPIRINFRGLSDVYIKNNGFGKATYNISLLGANWIELVDHKITVEPLKTNKIRVYINAPNTTGSYPLTITLSTSKDNISLKYQQEVLLRVTGEPWYNIIKNWLLQRYKNPCNVLGFILIVAILIVLILLFKAHRGPEKSNRKPLIILVSGVLLLVVFIITFIVTAYFTGLLNALKPQQPRISGLNITLPQGNSIKINLSTYFYDPDLDVLRFESQPDKGLIVTINDSIATIKPVNSFEGKTNVVFIAIDTKGASTKSPKFNVRVIKRHDPLNVISTRYCWYIDLLLFALLLIAILFLIAEITREPLYKPVFVIKSKNSKSKTRFSKKH